MTRGPSRGRKRLISQGCPCPVFDNAVNIVELAVEKGAQAIMIPVSARRQLNDLSNEMAAKINIIYCLDVKDALLKSISD
jgi:ATP-dependent Lon protease